MGLTSLPLHYEPLEDCCTGRPNDAPGDVRQIGRCGDPNLGVFRKIEADVPEGLSEQAFDPRPHRCASAARAKRKYDPRPKHAPCLQGPHKGVLRGAEGAWLPATALSPAGHAVRP